MCYWWVYIPIQSHCKNEVSDMEPTPYSSVKLTFVVLRAPTWAYTWLGKITFFKKKKKNLLCNKTFNVLRNFLSSILKGAAERFYGYTSMLL